MSDPQWNHLPDELKALGQKPPETPQNPVEFKERVLREYERRTRFHLRARWMRRAMTAVTVCAAMLVGVLVAKPADREALPPSSSSSNQPQTFAGNSPFIANPESKTMAKQDARAPQLDEAVVYDALNQQDLLGATLRFLTPSEAQDWLQTTAAVPSDKWIDPAREVGYYLLNGSVRSVTFGEGNDLQVEVSEDVGHLQVLRIPYTRLAELSGKQVTLHVFDEGGQPVIPTQTVQVP
ncbi:hypothetical protein [Tumebacillus permanentifrigoris]|uniref:Uncharacterized protein n=1 Tax=Tumebacillus permanentifrigoris TaxID=378543 RepID=A0A316DCX2_9BACL|nr:hypothetical protein [Tumebacillus permanentifrigoris]PWK13165.1 hypothetical protein C7459_108186 [Tumebacillus permanentifrigoris]